MTLTKMLLHRLGQWLASPIWLFTLAEALGEATKVVASSPQGGGLQAQCRSLTRLRSWVL